MLLAFSLTLAFDSQTCIHNIIVEIVHRDFIVPQFFFSKLEAIIYFLDFPHLVYLKISPKLVILGKSHENIYSFPGPKHVFVFASLSLTF